MLPRNDESALNDIEERINSMERRLRNAQAAKNAYVQYLRSKYPNWRPIQSSLNFDNETVINKLATSDYHWDTDVSLRNNYSTSYSNQMTSGIPKSGPLLESDIRNAKRRLIEISAQLRNLRDNRMSMSTESFMRSVPFLANQREPLKLASVASDEQIMADVRQRLSSIRYSEYEPPKTPTGEDKLEEELRIEREKMIEDIRAGRTAPTPPPEPQQVRFVEPNVDGKKEEVKTAPLEKIIIPESEIREPKPVQTQILPIPVVPEPAPIQGQNAYTKMMSLLSQPNEESSDESETAPAPQPAPAVKPNPPTPGMGLLSQYLSKVDDSSSSDDGLTIKKSKTTILDAKPKPSMSTALANDSDDDFFD
ncbi:unnamed protein product [Caenorhabditis bovis]|uniref:Uncharacterized protein n=1 Tax=Caenorhabditis bovis TaxID=2654633 RepID=A0A8S1E9B4_9PELO|nr:unnamed protein product [Caenorhabditis bovis]